jgi:hypothetical protein
MKMARREYRNEGHNELLHHLAGTHAPGELDREPRTYDRPRFPAWHPSRMDGCNFGAGADPVRLDTIGQE